MLNDVLKATKPRMEEVVKSFEADIKNIHTGRASAALVEDLKINHYNSLMPLKQIASIASPSATLIVITPWDKGALNPIEVAIKESGLNINPINDGQVVRISLPPMSEERRQELVKLINQKSEAARIAVRNIREDAWKQIQREEKAGDLTEDDRYDGERDLNKLITEINTQIDEVNKRKEKEIMTI